MNGVFIRFPDFIYREDFHYRFSFLQKYMIFWR
jgi:hypothetical protein